LSTSHVGTVVFELVRARQCAGPLEHVGESMDLHEATHGHVGYAQRKSLRGADSGATGSTGQVQRIRPYSALTQARPYSALTLFSGNASKAKDKANGPGGRDTARPQEHAPS